VICRSDEGRDGGFNRVNYNLSDFLAASQGDFCYQLNRVFLCTETAASGSIRPVWHSAARETPKSGKLLSKVSEL
jgi:hypothetical protein